MKIGSASAVITPPLGIPLGGFGNRRQVSSSLNDELKSTVIGFEKEGEYAILIGLDLLGFAPEKTNEIREVVASETGIEKEKIFLSFTHTHSGPAVNIIEEKVDMFNEWFEILKYKIVGIVKAAINNRKKGRLYTGRHSVYLGINRREKFEDGIKIGYNPEGPVDPELDLLRFEDQSGNVIAGIVRYSCHPVVLGGDSYRISRDYPGVLVDKLSRYLKAPVLFLQGTAGNINPPVVNADLKEMKRVGEILAGAAVVASNKARLQKVDNLEISNYTVMTDPGELPSREEIKAKLKARQQVLASEPGLKIGLKKDSLISFYERTLTNFEELMKKESYRLQLNLIRLGSLDILLIPGEAFVEYGLYAKELKESVLPVGYANEYIGYVPTAKAFEEGGYEVENSYKLLRDYPLTPALESEIKKGIRELLL